MIPMSNAIDYGCYMQSEELPEWEDVLSSAARLQKLLPGAVLIRTSPLETTQMEFKGEILTVPTEAEILRIKGVLILRRNATRDYLDFAALADHMGREAFFHAIGRFDELYPHLHHRE